MSRAALLALVLAGLPALANSPAAPAMALEAQAVAAPLLTEHPVALFQEAMALWDRDQPEASVFLFYLAQLRWRRYMQARPDLPPDQDAALFGALHARFGPVVNGWAFGDLDGLVTTLNAVADFDATAPDPLTPRETHGALHDSALAGFRAFVESIARDAETIRAHRQANGLENR
jgi:hypothetical protein